VRPSLFGASRKEENIGINVWASVKEKISLGPTTLQEEGE